MNNPYNLVKDGISKGKTLLKKYRAKKRLENAATEVSTTMGKAMKTVARGKTGLAKIGVGLMGNVLKETGVTRAVKRTGNRLKIVGKLM